MSGRVLVAEDDRAVRESIERALPFEGYDVLTAPDGAEAIQRVLNDKPDAIVLDVMMPHVDGLEVARRLRTAGVKTPILMVTARVEISDRVAGLDAGADDYLVKPFALPELLARLRALLRRTIARRGGRDAARRRPRPRSGDAHRHARRGRRRAHEDGVRAARAADVERRDWCCRAARSTSACGTTTSVRRPTRSRCTSGTSVARPAIRS